MKAFGDKIEAGDKVLVCGWVSAVSPHGLKQSLWQNLHFPPVVRRDAPSTGIQATIRKVVDRNTVVINLSDGCFAVVHPESLRPA